MPGRAALVIEGGAMRGVFSAGVLDAFVARGFDPFDLAVGVSAGACNLASHLAEQRGRNRRCYLDLMIKREFIDRTAFFKRKSVIDLDWLWNTFIEREPLDVEALVRRTTEFVVVATAADTGEALYLTPSADDMLLALKGSCALPVLYRNPIYVGGVRIVDGGVSDPLPVEEAYRRGARKILVIRSRPADDASKGRVSSHLISILVRDQPKLARALRCMPDRYEASRAFLRNPPSDCTIVHVAPHAALVTGRTTQNGRALERDYRLGLGLGHEAVHRWNG